MVLDIGMLGKVEEVNTHSGEENFVIITMVVHIMEMAGLVIIQKEEAHNVIVILVLMLE